MVNIEQQLLDSNAYPDNVAQVEHIQTHISHIFLAGNYAYKIKKPLNLGFLDFSTLDKRQHFCKEELRLNSRLADAIYIDVVPIMYRNGKILVLNKNNSNSQDIVEYAVRMHRFDTDMELDQLLEDNTKKIWKDNWIDEISSRVAEFHAKVAIAQVKSNYGKPKAILSFALENFIQIKQHVHHQAIIKTVEQLNEWTQAQFNHLSNTMNSRRANGFIRECHGDMHLANMVYWQNKVQIFDGIEFNDSLRWIDVISEISFLFMDLEARERSDLAWRFLNDYLSTTGDYAGLELFNFYLVYRACVRAKVMSIRSKQLDNTKQQKDSLAQVRHYLRLADSYTDLSQVSVIMLHGLSGSGKSTIAAKLVQKLKAIWIRSDVERKRLFGHFKGIPASLLLQGNMYTSKVTIQTYQRLLDLAKTITQSGYSVVVDATFLQVKHRQMFYQAFDEIGIPITILDFQVEKHELQSRVHKRSKEKNNISDADVSILEQQFHSLEPIEDSEGATVLSVDANTTLDSNEVINKIYNSINETH
ncbi:MAG: AAA family ATPase [Candidatus Thioglobus sp.]|nr:AAA family ATPase [Candidatus Thioglobus pontius]MBL6985128.1 AAA family ATPase [Candidatus Thioglobus sp.]